MGLRVLHKGLILVAVPLLLQLVVIGLLAILLVQTDRQQAREAERCRLSMIGARLLFANCEAGNILMNAFKMQNSHMLDNFYQECDYIDKLNKQMSIVPEDDAVEGRELQLRCLKAQAAVTARMREIADLATEGFGMETLRLVLASHRKLVKELDTVFGLLRLRYQDLDAGLPEHWKQLQMLRDQENTVILSALASTIVLAIGLILFYRKEFLLRIQKVTTDVESLTHGRSLSSPLRGHDEIASLDASFHNMSIQLSSVAERERALFENSSDMICILDQDLKFMRVNNAASRFCSATAETLSGKALASILSTNSAEEIKQIEERLQSARATRSATQFEAKLSGFEPGSTEPIAGAGWKPALPGLDPRSTKLEPGSAGFQPASSPANMITLWSIFWSPDQKTCHCVVHDVSEERQLDKMREAFLRLIAADFSKPLTQIAQLVEKLSAGAFGKLPEMATSKIVGATGTLSRMVSMVDELIQLETLKSNSLNLKPQTHSVKSILQETIKDTEAAAERKQIKLQIDCPDELKFDVDFDRIVRVLMNFVSNAIKFSPDGATVLLSAQATGQIDDGSTKKSGSAGYQPASDGSSGSQIASGSEIVISVIDEGRGIPKEAISSLFQAFKQVSAADGKRGKGTGLGLVVCKRIVEEHGGQVGVESEEGKGSRFWLSIPVSAESSQTRATHSEVRQGPIAELASDGCRTERVAPTIIDGSEFKGSASKSSDTGSNPGSAVAPPASQGSQIRALESESIGFEPGSTLRPLPIACGDGTPAVLTGFQPAPTPVRLTTPQTKRSQSNFWERLSFKQKGLLLIGLPILCQCIFATAMIFFLNESAQSYAKQMHNRFVCRNAVRTAAPIFHLLIALRTDGQESSAANTCRTVLAEEGERVNALKASTKGDQMAAGYYRRISQYLKNTLMPLTRRLLDDLIEYGGQPLEESENRRYANVVVGMLGGLTMHVRELVDACEKRDQDTPIRLKQLRQIEAVALIAALLVNIAAAGWLAFYFAADVMRRLLVLSDNSQRLSTGRALNNPLTGSDEIAALDKAFHDTAVRLAEARATESTFLDNANNIICSLDENGRFISLNRVAADKLCIPFDKYQEYKLLNLLSADEQNKLETFLDRVKDNKLPSAIELRVQTAESIADIVWSFLWSDTEHQYFAVAYDITARRDLDRMKKEFLALVTHDLRTPLTTIQGMAIILETDKLGVLPPAARECMVQIRQETRQILELVNDLLDLSKLEAGELNCDLAAMSISSLLDKLSEQLKETGIQIQLADAKITANDAQQINADLDRLSYAISGMALELFPENTILKLETDKTSDSLQLKISGSCKNLNANDLLSLNSEDASQYSSHSARRLRLPLSRKLLQMHQITSNVSLHSTNGSDSQELSLSLLLPLLGAPASSRHILP